MNLAIASIISYKTKPMVGELKNYTRNEKHDFRFRGQKMINDSCFCNATERQYDYILSEIDKGNLPQKEFGEL